MNTELIDADVCFLVTTHQQWSDASATVPHLCRAQAIAFDPYRDAIVDLSAGSFTRRRISRPGYRRAASAAATVRHWSRGGQRRVIVCGNDFGLVERACLAAARRSGAAVVLVPDGLASDAELTTAGRMQRTKDATDKVLRTTKLLVGARGRFGASAPDVVCAWGPAWTALWERNAPGSRHVVTGSPRSWTLATVPSRPKAGHLLVCSQPLSDLGGDAAAHVRGWYRWIERLAASGGSDVRVRLHPGEAQQGTQLELGASSALSTGTLLEDLEWADAVVAPFSTVLVEAAACGRTVAAVDVGVTRWLDASPFFRDGRVPRMHALDETDLDAVWACLGRAADEQAQLGSDFMSEPSAAGAKVAAVVEGSVAAR